ncbi:MAG: 16S rRNA (guanine(527)-N(7))-methyltransferase RsmG [Vulcanimicrobiaceae bacterium]
MSATSDLVASSDGVRERLARYVALLSERNAATNLTAARDPAAVAAHVRDSLGLVGYVREPHVDIGSGGGFPAIPLAIATGYRMTLVESIAKKATFLREIALELGLPLDVVCARAEDVGRNPAYRGRFASATARAVAGVTTVLEYAVPLLAVDGVCLLQRGGYADVERSAASDAGLVLGARLVGEYAVIDGTVGSDVPGDADGRRLLVFAKSQPTAARFPRRAGIPAKRPLCVPPTTR